MREKQIKIRPPCHIWLDYFVTRPYCAFCYIFNFSSATRGHFSNVNTLSASLATWLKNDVQIFDRRSGHKIILNQTWQEGLFLGFFLPHSCDQTQISKILYYSSSGGKWGATVPFTGEPRVPTPTCNVCLDMGATWKGYEITHHFQVAHLSGILMYIIRWGGYPWFPSK